MNNLNSVLIEGALEENPKFSNENGISICRFTLISRRHNGPSEIEINRVPIETRGKLAESCQKVCLKARIARVVGRMFVSPEKTVVIAEHVEVKPTQEETA